MRGARERIAALRRLDTRAPAASGAVVMGTGIVSDALQSDGHHALSAALLVIACVVWAALAAVAVDRWRTDPARATAEARTPAALTAVAATGVLGTRLTIAGADAIGVVALAFTLVGWAQLQLRVLRAGPLPAAGASFLLAVSTQALCTLVAAVALERGWSWAVWPAVALLVVGLAEYAAVLLRFDAREVGRGSGDQWVAGGALAIAALAAAYVALLARATGQAGGLHLGDVAVVLWVAAAAWAPVLAAAELARPRLRYATARWATVFPLGMYAESAIVAGRAGGAPWLRDAGRAETWVALAAWAVVAAGTALAVRRAAQANLG